MTFGRNVGHEPDESFDGSPNGTFANVMVRSPDGQLQQVTGFAFDRLTVLKQPYNDIPVRVGGAIRPK